MSGLAAPLMIAGSAVSAYGKMKAGRAQEKMYDARAAQTLLQGRAEAARYKQQGADVLSRLNENLATLINRAGATGSGNIQAIFNANIATASTDYATAQDNIVLAQSFSEDQAHQYRLAGDAARRSANISALGTIITGAYRYGRL